MPRIRTLVFVALAAAGCEHNVGPQTAAAAAEAPEATVRLPSHWQGTGILADRNDTPNAAPQWSRMKAEVVERNGQRFLRATGRADDVENPALGRSAAQNRARAELAHWLQQNPVSGAQLVDSWNAGSQVYLALVEVALPATALVPTK